MGLENKGQSMKHTQQTLREEKLHKRAISLCVKVLVFFFKVNFLTYLKIPFTKL